MTNEELLIEIEYLLRSFPDRQSIHIATPDNIEWLGRTAAILKEWNPGQWVIDDSMLNDVLGGGLQSSERAINSTLLRLNQAKHELRMKTAGPTDVAIESGNTFRYFEEIRKIIEMACEDILFIDPYLDADFVSRYLPYIKPGVNVRLLTFKCLKTLLPAVKEFKKQHSLSIEVRKSSDLHDRHVFIDFKECYQSGASFKDGADKRLTTLTQITDVFPEVLAAYEKIWSSATKKE